MAVIAVWPPIAGAQPSVLDDVDECDTLASHPHDNERVADGVADDAIIPKLAAAACEAALKLKADNPRFLFQLGRAYSAAGRRKEAAEQFQKASDQGYGAALAYLGDAYQFGYGVTPDTDKALDAYKKASAKGFSPADGQIEMLTFSPAMYINPLIFDLYEGKVESSNTNAADIQAYLFSFVMALTNECNAILTPRGVVSMYERRYPEGWTQESDAAVKVGVMNSFAEYDAKLFLRRHGCEGPVAARIKANLNRMYSNR